MRGITTIFGKPGPDTIIKMSDLNSTAKRHQFFVFTCTNFEPSNYVCWACTQQYRNSPNKRKMIFIDRYFTTDTPVSGNAANISQDMTEAYKILKFVNVGTDQINAYRNQIGNQVQAAQQLKTFAQKQEFMGGGTLGALKAVLVKGIAEDANAFSTLEADLDAAMTDFRQRFKFSNTYQMPAGTRQVIPETVRLLTEATFDAHSMGVW